MAGVQPQPAQAVKDLPAAAAPADLLLRRLPPPPSVFGFTRGDRNHSFSREAVDNDSAWHDQQH